MDSLSNNVVNYLFENSVKFNDRVIFRWKIDSDLNNKQYDNIRYGKFYTLVSSMAGGLLDLGFRRGDNVLIFLPVSVELYVSLSAVMMIGARAVFIDSWARRNELGSCSSQVQPKGIISREKVLKYFSDVSEIQSIPIKISLEDNNEYSSTIGKLINNKKLAKIQPVGIDDTALITFTTGSSGAPKGADRTHGFLTSQHLALKRTIPYLDNDIDLPVFPVFSLNNLASAVSMVIPAIDAGNPGENDAEMIAEQMLSQKVTTATLSPSMLVRIGEYCRDKGIVIPLVRRVITGGAPVSRASIEKIKSIIPNGELVILYGSTEVEPISHIRADELLACKTEGKGVLVGKVDEKLDYRIIEIVKSPIKKVSDGFAGLEKKQGEIGELIVSGPHVCRSYYKNPDADSKTKIIDNFGRIWHRTGDLARVDKNGMLWIEGRIHNIINRNGQMLFPVDVEEKLKGHYAVNRAAYVGIPDINHNEKASVVVELKAKFLDNKTTIIEEIKRLLEAEKYPYDELAVIDKIPMDPRHNSKVDYVVLRSLLNISEG